MVYWLVEYFLQSAKRTYFQAELNEMTAKPTIDARVNNYTCPSNTIQVLGS